VEKMVTTVCTVTETRNRDDGIPGQQEVVEDGGGGWHSASRRKQNQSWEPVPPSLEAFRAV